MNYERPALHVLYQQHAAALCGNGASVGLGGCTSGGRVGDCFSGSTPQYTSCVVGPSALTLCQVGDAAGGTCNGGADAGVKVCTTGTGRA